MSLIGTLKSGDLSAQEVSQRIGGAVADATALAAVGAAYLTDNQIWLKLDTGDFWYWDADSTATASDAVIAHGSGTGRFLACGGGSAGTARGAAAVRIVTQTTLPAYTRVVNVLTANANGALGTTDGVTLAAGDLFLLKNGAAGADNGIYVLDSAGSGSTKWQATRAPGFDSSADFLPNPFLVAVSEGTVGADKVYILATNETITLNTTSLSFTQLPDLADLADTSAGLGASLIGVQDADSQLTGATAEAALAEIATCALPNSSGVHYARGASTANVAALATFTVANDGITFVQGERVFLKNQTATEENGIYVVGVVGGGTAPLTRATDFDNAQNVRPGVLVYVAEGTAGADTLWELTTNATIVVGTTGLTFVDAVHGTAGAAAGTIADAGAVLTATTIEGSLQELALKDAGAVMVNRCIVDNAGTAIPQGDYLTIGADVYEFRSSTPPAGGTAGRIWVYNGANSAASRTNLVNAINGVVDAATITYDGAVTELCTAVAGVPATGISWYTSTAIGSAVPRATGTTIVCAENLTHALDILDQANMYAGVAQATQRIAMTSHTVTAAEVTAASLQFYFPFTVGRAIVFNSTFGYHDEVVTWTGNYVSVTITGGASPNIQAADVLVCFASV